MKVEIRDKYIKLGQFIKKINLVDTGGETKHFIKTHHILINDKKPLGRSTKIFCNDVVWIDDNPYKIVKKKETKAIKA